MRVSCRLYVEVTEPEDLLTLDLEALPQPLFVMGGGSNLLFTGDFPGTVLHMANTGHTVIPDTTSLIPGLTRNLLVRVAAGVVFDDFCAWAAAEGLWGPENLSLIPGEVGACAVQNIGAYGVEAKDIIDTVHAFDRQERRFVDIPGADCGYGYRTSRFKSATASLLRRSSGIPSSASGSRSCRTRRRSGARGASSATRSSTGSTSSALSLSRRRRTARNMKCRTTTSARK